MHGLNWGEFGQGSRKAVVVSYKPDDMVVLKATNECEETHTLTFVFQAVAYDDANLSYDDAVAYNRERIRQIIKNIWGEYFDKKISLEQITPEVADFVQKVADEIIYQSQGMLMVDIVYNNWLTGIPKWSQTLFAHGTTMTADRFNSEKRYVFETYSNWFKVWNKEHAHLAVIRAAALKHRSELEILLLNQSMQN